MQQDLLNSNHNVISPEKKLKKIKENFSNSIQYQDDTVVSDQNNENIQQQQLNNENSQISFPSIPKDQQNQQNSNYQTQVQPDLYNMQSVNMTKISLNQTKQQNQQTSFINKSSVKELFQSKNQGINFQENQEFEQELNEESELNKNNKNLVQAYNEIDQQSLANKSEQNINENFNENENEKQNSNSSALLQKYYEFKKSKGQLSQNNDQNNDLISKDVENLNDNNSYEKEEVQYYQYKLRNTEKVTKQIFFTQRDLDTEIQKLDKKTKEMKPVYKQYEILNKNFDKFDEKMYLTLSHLNVFISRRYSLCFYLLEDVYKKIRQYENKLQRLEKRINNNGTIKTINEDMERFRPFQETLAKDLEKLTNQIQHEKLKNKMIIDLKNKRRNLLDEKNLENFEITNQITKINKVLQKFANIGIQKGQNVDLEKILIQQEENLFDYRKQDPLLKLEHFCGSLLQWPKKKGNDNIIITKNKKIILRSQSSNKRISQSSQIHRTSQQNFNVKKFGFTGKNYYENSKANQNVEYENIMENYQALKSTKKQLEIQQQKIMTESQKTLMRHTYLSTLSKKGKQKSQFSPNIKNKQNTENCYSEQFLQNPQKIQSIKQQSLKAPNSLSSSVQDFKFQTRENFAINNNIYNINSIKNDNNVDKIDNNIDYNNIKYVKETEKSNQRNKTLASTNYKQPLSSRIKQNLNQNSTQYQWDGSNVDQQSELSFLKTKNAFHKKNQFQSESKPSCQQEKMVQEEQFLEPNFQENDKRKQPVQTQLMSRQAQTCIHDTLKNMLKEKKQKMKPKQELKLEWDKFKNFNFNQVSGVMTLDPKSFNEIKWIYVKKNKEMQVLMEKYRNELASVEFNIL
ncbi:hypothetical protein PPERSA_09065 [Pseudocohnilembus persalinus]|uniref:Uncharacterized protein n=1 Tax=Pseudocohnilembus persalinus TaxID=266149 RepID=A0A0V0QKX0_PSEPJ|nr:hypothetical protein PPERSA_09065 [Pseudocohnilembus persalinus]|eukprot:KRX02943.1 hypothetical protein PPERSA_09065 [Pseudocohnilembus persalinus]